MSYRDELNKALQNEINIADAFIAEQVEANFDNLTEEQFESLCVIVKFCWDCGRSVDATINYIIEKCYYSYENNIQLLLDRVAAEDIQYEVRG